MVLKDLDIVDEPGTRFFYDYRNSRLKIIAENDKSNMPNIQTKEKCKTDNDFLACVRWCQIPYSPDWETLLNEKSYFANFDQCAVVMAYACDDNDTVEFVKKEDVKKFNIKQDDVILAAFLNSLSAVGVCSSDEEDPDLMELNEYLETHQDKVSEDTIICAFQVDTDVDRGMPAISHGIVKALASAYDTNIVFGMSSSALWAKVCDEDIHSDKANSYMAQMEMTTIQFGNDFPTRLINDDVVFFYSRNNDTVAMCQLE